MDEGGVRVEHERIARRLLQQAGGLKDCMRGAELLCLNDDLGTRIEGEGALADGRGTMAGNDDRPVGVEGLAGPHGMVQKRGRAKAMQHLGQVRIHPCPLASGKNDKRDGHRDLFPSVGVRFNRARRGRKPRAITLPFARFQGPAVRTVVFDLDGTLADTSGDLIAAANACFTGLGHACLLDANDALTAFHGGRAMLRLGFSRLGQVDEAEVDRQYPVLLAAYERSLDVHTRLYPGAVAAVEALRAAGFATAVCTNKPEGLAETLMRRLGMRPLFGALVGADTLAVRKPDPAPLFEAVARVGGSAGRALLVGDTDTDRQTGRAAGVPVALVTFGPEGRGVARLNPEALLDHFDELPSLAQQILRA